MFGVDIKKVAAEITEEVTGGYIRELFAKLDLLHKDLQVIIKLLEKQNNGQ